MRAASMKARSLVDECSPHNDADCVPPWIYIPQFPGSVNLTIISDDFLIVMLGIDRFFSMILRFGRGVMIMKKDLISTYKHQRVHMDDLKLQVVMFGDRFIELCLMFGVRSSLEIFCYPIVC